MIRALIEMYIKFSRNTEEKKILLLIEQSWGQGEDGQLGKKTFKEMVESTALL